jgi:DNA processing protein
MQISDNALNVLAACEYRGIGKAWVNKNLRGGESVAQIVPMVSEKDGSATVPDFERRRLKIRSEIELLGEVIDGVVGLGDEDFPEIQPGVKAADRPIALFYRGDISLIKNVSSNVAVIGLLTPSERIEKEERAVVRKLVADGKCIVSGLALGCDTIGHREALDCGGKTVAFLSSPLTEINPPSNRPLAWEIVENGGLLVTEYFRKALSKREFIGRYAERDRLQAMFAGAVVLAASYSQKDFGKDSGSRFAMGKAAEYGVPRYVIYDVKRDGADPMFNLSREEILKGAKVLDCESDCILTGVRSCGSQLEFVM